MGRRPGFDVSDAVTHPDTEAKLLEALKRTAADLRPDDVLIAAAVPSRGWLADYLAYTDPISESPLQFNLIAGLAVLASTVGRRAYIDHGDEQLFPNIYACIVAEQSRLRKSTALSSGRKLALDAFPGDEDHRGAIMPDDFSDEGLADALRDNPTGLFVWSEFGFVLGTSQKTYSATSRQFLADVFDAPDRRERLLRSGAVCIEGPAPSILTASTFSWLQERVRDADILGGFLSRFLYVCGSEKSKVLPFRPRADANLRARLQVDLRGLRDSLGHGRRLGVDGIRAAYTTYYHRYEGNERLEAEDHLAGFYSRLCTYAVKLTMLYQLSMNADAHELTPEAWGHTVALLEFLRRGMCKVVGELSEDKGFALALKVFGIIRKRHATTGRTGVDRRWLTQHAHLQVRDLDPCLTTLIEAGMVREDKTDSGGRRYIPADCEC